MNDSVLVSKRDILLACLLLTILILLSGGLGIYVLSDPGLRQAHTMIAAARQIGSWYHEEVDWPDAVRAARNGMVQMLDRFSGYVTEEEFEQMHEDQSGGYSGIGVTITRRSEAVARPKPRACCRVISSRFPTRSHWRAYPRGRHRFICAAKTIPMYG